MSSKRSIRADKTPPRRSRGVKQMVDIRGFALSTEQGAPLVTEKEEYRRSEYGADTAPSVVLNSESYQQDALSTQNSFSKGDPAAFPIIERFAEQSEVSRSLLGINRETTQQGLFGNVSTYGLDPKDWRVDQGKFFDSGSRYWWTRRPSATGNYYPVRFDEDELNAAIVLSANPTPFLEPPRPSIQDQLTRPGGAERYTGWGQYLNSIVALYLFRYVVENLSEAVWDQFNLGYMLETYPPIRNQNGTYTFNELYWDKIWLDIKQNRFGPISNYPVVPNGRAYNFNTVSIDNWRANPALWGTSNVIIAEATSRLPQDLNVSWDSFFFSVTRAYYPSGRSEDRGHYRIQTNPSPDLWEKYFGLRWDELRSDLKNWEFRIHTNEASVTQLERDLKLPYFVLDTPLVPDRTNNVFSDTWPSEAFGEQIDLPTDSNRIGGVQGIETEITLKSIRAFRYQPGRISGFTYGVKVSEIGAGPGTVLEFGIENDTDSYMFRLSNGANFSVIRRSTVPLEDTQFLQNAKYAENTRNIIRNGQVQYETVIEQKIMNGDPLGGEGESGYVLDPDTVTMYKIEFGWYGAIGARFYAYVPVGNNDCRWVTLHTLVIENQLGRPCLADPFFYFKYRLLIGDSSTIRVDQYVNKFGASYYIDGYDEGTLYSLNAQSRVQNLPNPRFSEIKTQLNAIDWVTLMGIKPRTFLINRFGTELYNKKEIFPENAFIYSQQDCEIKVVRQRGCPEWAYTHQEGYEWSELPASRRLKGKFTIDPYFTLDRPALGISADDGSTHSAVAAYSTEAEGGYRNPTISGNWSVVGNQAARVIGDDLYALFPAETKDFSSGSLTIKLQRDGRGSFYLSSREPLPQPENIYLPYLYAPVSPYTQGYDIEFDYFRRDQILLSTVDVLSDEFYIYWVGGPGSGISGSGHASSLRFGFVWPEVSDTDNDLYATEPNLDWGIEPVAEWDEENFYEGLPYDFVNDHPQNTLYFETNPTLAVDTYNRESGEFFNYGDYYDLGDNRIAVPGSEGGICRGLFCKAGREVRDGISIIFETDPVTSEVQYFVSDLQSPWPNLGGEQFTITLVQGTSTANVSTTGGITRTAEGGVTIYLLPIGNLLPSGISVGEVSASYNIIYIATINKRSQVRQILTSKIAPGNLPFLRVFVQGRQGAKLGGVWVGQKTSRGVDVRPLTPHRSTVSISDSGGPDYHSEWSNDPQLDGAVKVITTYTQPDQLGLSTSPTFNASELNLDSYKSFHTNPRKCGSFLSAGGTNSAGIFTNSQYPIRYLSNPDQAIPLATYYISANTPTEINLSTVFNVSAESIVNEDDGTLATFFIARSLNNHNESSNEIYMSLNYSEQ